MSVGWGWTATGQLAGLVRPERVGPYAGGLCRSGQKTPALAG